MTFDRWSAEDDEMFLSDRNDHRVRRPVRTTDVDLALRVDAHRCSGPPGASHALAVAETDFHDVRPPSTSAAAADQAETVRRPAKNEDVVDRGVRHEPMIEPQRNLNI